MKFYLPYLVFLYVIMPAQAFAHVGHEDEGLWSQILNFKHMEANVAVFGLVILLFCSILQKRLALRRQKQAELKNKSH